MDSDSERRLRELRLNLAEVCLEGRIDRIAALTRNPSGDAILTMINSGVRHLYMSKADQAVAERCHRILSVEHDIARKVAAYLALSLFAFPHGIERAFDIVDVPTPLLATVVKTLLSVPVFFTKEGARRRALAHVEATVQEIHKAVTVIDEEDFRKEVLAGFMDGYVVSAVYSEDVSLRALAQKRAELIRMYLEINDLARDIVPAPRGGNDTIVRVGLLCPGALSETAALRGHLLGLDTSVFQVIAFVPDEAATSVSAGFEDLADDFIALPVNDIPQAAEIIAGENLDILIAGANLTNACRFPWTLLMAQRLARLQVAMHSSCLTTGFPTVDLFVNGILNEPDDARDDYTEELALFPGSSNHYAFPATPVVPETITREQIGVPDAALLLASGANYFKIGPDLINAWARILEAVPNAHLMMYPFNPNWTTHYPYREGFLRFVQERFAAKGVEVERLHVLEAQPTRAPILGLLKVADLYLDSFPYSGAVSLMDPISMGCPPVVREGHTARCRQSAALLREIGLDVLVTRSTDDYVTVVTRLLQDHTLRREMSEAVIDVSRTYNFGPGGAEGGLGADVGDILLAALRKKLKTSVV
jgi:predicted O-linked N-acetylglucosamine transferase (SPINDLY family)